MRGRRRRGGSGLAGLVLSLFLSLSIFLLLFSTVTAHGGQNAQQQQQQQQQSAHAHRHIPFEYGDELKIDCITPDANGTVYVDQHGEPIYGPGPTCQETGESWTFHYGVEQIIVCRWLIDQALYNFLRMVIAGQATYRCRLRMSKDGMIYMPYPISIWGGVEPQHIHVMNHYSWNFHVGLTDWAVEEVNGVTDVGCFIGRPRKGILWGLLRSLCGIIFS